MVYGWSLVSGPTAGGIGESVRRGRTGASWSDAGATSRTCRSSRRCTSPSSGARTPTRAIVGVDARPARALPGVRGVLVLGDLPELRGALPAPAVPAAPVKPYRQSPLADGVVRFAGEAVAVVVATDPYRATRCRGGRPRRVRAAARGRGRRAGARRRARRSSTRSGATNVAATVSLETGDLDAALRRAAVVVTRRFRCGRVTALPLEPRAVAARWDPVTPSLHVWSSTQMPYGVRQRVAEALGLPPDGRARHRARRGGGFGTKGPVYPEELIVAALARRLGSARALDRHAARELPQHDARGRPGPRRDPRARRRRADPGARRRLPDRRRRLPPAGRGGGQRDGHAPASGSIASPRSGVAGASWPRTRCRAVAVPRRRAARRPCSSLERLMDIAARELGLDPVELRRRNLIRADEMPYRRELPYRDGMPMVHDSGDYPASARDRAGAGRLRRRFASASGRRAREGRRLGIGIAAYNEATGIGPHEGATRRDRRAPAASRVTVGAPSQGQGHETTLAQICAERLGVPLDVGRRVGRRHRALPGEQRNVREPRGRRRRQRGRRGRRRRAASACGAWPAARWSATPADVVIARRARPRAAALRRAVCRPRRAPRALPVAPTWCASSGEPGLAATRYHSPESVTWAAASTWPRWRSMARRAR